MKKPSTAAIWTAMLAVYIIWGSTYLAIHYAVATIPPFLMGGMRFLIAGSILYLARRVRGDPAPGPRQWRSAGLVGFCLLTMGNGGVVWAERHGMPSGITSLLVSTVPLWMVLLDWWRPGGRRPGGLALVGLLIGFAGVVLLIGPALFEPGGQGSPYLLGAAALTAGAWAWATGSLYGRSAPLPVSPLLGTGMEMLVGGAGMLLVGSLTGEWSQFHPAAITPASLAGLAYLVAFGSLIAFSAYVWLLRNAPTPLVATYAYVNPVVALFLGFLVAGEPLSQRAAVAAAIIVGSVVLTTRARRAPEPGSAHAVETELPPSRMRG